MWSLNSQPGNQESQAIASQAPLKTFTFQKIYQ